jgi:uncharacterized DUF497 family protein
MDYNFEWDDKKAKTNKVKHRVSFERAASVFKDSNAISIPDEEHSDSEERWITLGLDNSSVLLTVIHTFLYQSPIACRIRIISARKATHQEQEYYQS